MKILSKVLACLTGAAVWGIFWRFFNCSFAPIDVMLPIICYGICLCVCPFLGIRPMRGTRWLWSFLLILLLSGGICGLVFLCGNFSMPALLAVLPASILLGVLMVHRATPQETATTQHLFQRGLKASHIRRVAVLRHGYATFFRYSGVLLSFIIFFNLFIQYNSVLSVGTVLLYAAPVLIAEIVGYLLYLLLGAPKMPQRPVVKGNGLLRKILLAVIVLILLLTVLYTFFGHAYVAPEALPQTVIAAVREIFTIAILAGGVAWVLGFLCGILFHWISSDIFGGLLRGVVAMPAFIISFLLLPFGRQWGIYGTAVAVAVPLFVTTVLTTMHAMSNFQQHTACRLTFTGKQYARLVATPTLITPVSAQLLYNMRIGLYITVFSEVCGLRSTVFAAVCATQQGLFMMVAVLIFTALALNFACSMVKEERQHG